LDPFKEEDRKIVEEFWTGFEVGEIVNGLPVQAMKYFK